MANPHPSLPPNRNRSARVFRNRRVTRAIAQLDPLRDHAEIVRLLACYEFPFDTTRALEMALFRTFASPKVSALLDRTKEFHAHGQKRYDDTAILITEFMVDGYDGPIGRRAIAQMNRMHSAYPIDNAEYLFVLSTFIFDPINWLARYGWRPLTEGEQTALAAFWRQVALRMGVRDVPPDLPAFRAWMEAYQREHFRYADTNRRVADATVRIVQGWLPAGLKWAAFPSINALIDKDLRAAFGYRQPSPLWSALVKSALWLRRQLLKVFTVHPTPKTAQTTYYPTYPTHHYTIEQIGPPRLVAGAERKEQQHQEK